jgi:hypothetical protein
VGGQHHTPAAKDQVTIVQEVGWDPGLVWVCAKKLHLYIYIYIHARTLHDLILVDNVCTSANNVDFFGTEVFHCFLGNPIHIRCLLMDKYSIPDAESIVDV